MKATICVAAMALVIGSAIAQQGSSPQSPQSPASSPQASPQSSPSQTAPDAQTPKDMKSGKEVAAR